MIVARDIHAKIIDSLKKRGPSLPIQLAKDLNMNSLFISAFLSELLDDKKIKMSDLKVGGTHLYLLEGQEKDLEKFHTFLHPKEIEAYRLLKENKVLKESDQEPAIRVALKSIKDFSTQIKQGENTYFRYMAVPEIEALQLINLRKGAIEQKQTKPMEIIERKIEISIPNKIDKTKTEVNKEFFIESKIIKPNSEMNIQNQNIEMTNEERIKPIIKIEPKELPKVKGIPNTMMQEIANHQNKVNQMKKQEIEIEKDSEEEIVTKNLKDFEKKFEEIIEKTSFIEPIIKSRIELEKQKPISIEEIVGISKKSNDTELKEAKISDIEPEFTQKLNESEEPKIITNQFKNPFISKPEEKKNKEKPKSRFVLDVIDFIEKNFRLIEEKDHKAKEYLCLVEVDTPLGPIKFLTQAKDKKSISDTDLHKFLSEAQSIPLPALVLYTKELSKKAKEYLEKYSSIIKSKKIE